jgi:PadR family transcriptional regulator PadR
MEDYLENINAQFRKGLLDFTVLIVIEKGEAYASDILKVLRKKDLIIVEGTLYPLLGRLKKHELVTYEWKESKSGPPRKYYNLTEKGKKALTHLKKSWTSLHTSINSLLSQ